MIPGILNTVIALVVVLLVLSLIVQSVQTLIKKLLKLKSGQIKASLEDLYEQAIQRTNTPIPPFGTRLTTKLQKLFKRGSVAKSNAERFSEGILNEFKGIGRVTVFGRPVLDSLSKDDLLKVMGKLELERFFPQYVAKFDELRTHIAKLAEAIQLISKNEALRGSVGTKVAELRSVLAPIFNDIESIATVETENSAEVRPRALFADLLRLRKLDIHQLIDLLGQAQTALAEERDSAANSRDRETVDKLNDLSKLLNDATTLVGGLTERFDDAVMPLRNKREQVELWFDTVTQSFDERYTRHMKTISILISICVVILLNANFFRVYENLSTNDVQRNLIAESGTEVLERARQSAPTLSRSASPASASAGATASPSPSPPMDVKSAIAEAQKEIDELADTYQGFGFSPLSWTQVVTSYKGFFGGQTEVRNARGDLLNAAGNPIPRGCENDADDGTAPDSCTPAWRPQTKAEWRASRRADIFTLFGWAIMTMLLSVGAPFWQDTLESLFGIKNLLRQKSETQNIEKKSGSGQPRE